MIRDEENLLASTRHLFECHNEVLHSEHPNIPKGRAVAYSVQVVDILTRVFPKEVSKKRPLPLTPDRACRQYGDTLAR